MINRIVHLTSVHGRYDVRIYTKECITLSNAGYEVYLVVADGKNDELINNVHIVDAGVSPGNRLTRMTKTVSKIYFKAIELDGDVYHFHDPELFHIALKLKGLGKKVIFDSHEDYTEDILNKNWIPLIFRKIISIAYNRFEKRSVKKIDGVVTATATIRKRFDAYTINTIDVNNYPVISKMQKEKKSKSNNIVYIGAIGKHRGIFEMLQAIKDINVNFIIAGTFITDKEYEGAKSMDGWKRVDYRHQIPRSEIESLLLQSSAGLVLFHPGPNHDDSQPNKLFEYMSAGLPVIASNFPLWKAIIEKNRCGICVNPLEPDEIKNAISYIIDNPLEAQEMGLNGLKAIHSTFNWTNESTKLLDFYKRLES